MRIVATVSRLLRNKRAVTALEYGILASLIAVAIVTAVGTLGSSLKNSFTFIASQL